MSRTKYSFKRHQELQHKPPTSPVFHRYRAPLPTPRALTGLAQPQQAPISGAGGQQGSLSPWKDPIQVPAPTTAMASSLFLQLLQLRSPQGHRCSCGFFLGTSQREGALTSTRERGEGAQAAGAQAADSIISAGEGGDCLKQVLPLSLSVRYEQGSLISLRC